jgi:hypothetical protein
MRGTEAFKKILQLFEALFSLAESATVVDDRE